MDEALTDRFRIRKASRSKSVCTAVAATEFEAYFDLHAAVVDARVDLGSVQLFDLAVASLQLN